MAECFNRWFDICQLADHLLEEKERTGMMPEVRSEEIYVLVRHLPEEREFLERLEEKVGGAQNLAYLFAAASCGPGGKAETRQLLKQFDDMILPASYDIGFEDIYRAAREQKESPVYDAKIVKFPGN